MRQGCVLLFEGASRAISRISRNVSSGTRSDLNALIVRRASTASLTFIYTALTVSTAASSVTFASAASASTPAELQRLKNFVSSF